MNWIIYPMALVGAMATTLLAWDRFLDWRDRCAMRQFMHEHRLRCAELDARHHR